MQWADIPALASVAGRVCLGWVFLIAAVDKLRHGATLAGVVANYRILPPRIASPFALVLPWIELTLGGALLVQVPSRAWPSLAIGLLIAFACAVAVNLHRGRSQIDCGCGRSALRHDLQWCMVVRNLALAALLIPSLICPAWPPLLPFILGAATGTSLYLLTVLFNAIAALSIPVRQPRI